MATDFLVKQGRVMGGVRLVTDADVAHQTDLTSIIQTGTTSTQVISAGKYFYLNDVLVRAKVDIANGATFTLNTNYEVVTAGGLNELSDKIKTKTIASVTSDANGFITLDLPNTCEVLGVSIIGYSIFAWKRSSGYWYATVVNGSIVPVASSTFSNVTVTYVE